jgi:CheY-like chemotaxis protein
MLVVDDTFFNVEFLRCQIELIPSMMTRCDYVDSGQKAIDLVKESLQARLDNINGPKYCLILLDYSMPNMDGPTTAIHICNAYKSYNQVVPTIVCLTAFTEKIFEQQARESGMN